MSDPKNAAGAQAANDQSVAAAIDILKDLFAKEARRFEYLRQAIYFELGEHLTAVKEMPDGPICDYRQFLGIVMHLGLNVVQNHLILWCEEMGLNDKLYVAFFDPDDPNGHLPKD